MTTPFQRVLLFGGGVLVGLTSYILLQRSTRNPYDYFKDESPHSPISNIENEKRLRYGYPGPINDISHRIEYSSSFNRRLKHPDWVIENLTKENLKSGSDKANRKNSKFKEDENIPSKFSTKLKDYFKSGYDRGHMAPAANAKRSQQAMDETFYLTNICPQVGQGFNQQYWAYLESFTRDLVNKFDEVFIITGPLYLPKKDRDGKWMVQYEVIGNPPNVAVPTHFYKIILGIKNNNPDAICAFLLPNKAIPNDTPLTDFVAPLEMIERAAGLEFFSKLGDNKEKRIPKLCDKVECSITHVITDWNKK